MKKHNHEQEKIAGSTTGMTNLQLGPVASAPQSATAVMADSGRPRRFAANKLATDQQDHPQRNAVAEESGQARKSSQLT